MKKQTRDVLEHSSGGTGGGGDLRVLESSRCNVER